MQKSDIIYGIRAIIEAINSGESINKVFLQRGLKGDLFIELEGLLRKEGITFSYVPMEKLNRLTKHNHQGAIAQISPISFPKFEALVEEILSAKPAPLFLLLDQLSDVRNFGAIIRTAECTGVDAIVVQNKGSAPVTADTIKTSAGAVFKVPITKVPHLKDAVFYLQGSGLNVVAATEKTTNSIYETNLEGPLALIMGSEEKGISPGLLKMVDVKAKLPLLGEIASLNVSVACGAVLYEVVRQRTSDSVL